MGSEINTSFNLSSDYINVKTSTIVKMNETFLVHTEDGPIELTTDIIADFVDIPEKYREVFMNVLTAKYLNKVSFGGNPFSQCSPVVKRKWYQIWKSKYFTN